MHLLRTNNSSNALNVNPNMNTIILKLIIECWTTLTAKSRSR